MINTLTPEGIPYPYIPIGRTIKYVAATDPYMSEASYLRDHLSTERNHPTGAVVVQKGVIIGRGANQAGLKNPRLQALHRSGWCTRHILNIPSGQKYWLCPGCAKSSHHAETRAVRDALKGKTSLSDADLYLYGHWWCCKPCWDWILKAGIRDVYLVEGATQMFRR